MRSIRTMVAAGVTLVALGGLTAVALSAGSSEPVGTSVPSAATEVRTQVEEQVVHRTRRARGTASSGGVFSGGGSPASSAPATSSSGPGPSAPAVSSSGPSAPAASHHRGHHRGSDDHGRHHRGDDHGRHHGGDDDDDDGRHHGEDDHGGDDDRDSDDD